MHRATGDTDPEAVISGLPRWQDTPNRYNLQVILWLRNLAVGWDLIDYAKWRFNMLSDSGNWFPGNRPRTVTEIPRESLERELRGHPRSREVVNLLEDAVQRLSGEDQRRLSQGGT
jgi:predicted aldo/keto reductase-like oxidoreductase